MPTLRETLESLSTAAGILISEIEQAGYKDYDLSLDNSPYDLSFLTPQGLGARGDVIAAAERISRLAKGPQGCLASYADMGIELGTIQALTQLGVPDNVPLQGSVSYEKLAASVAVSPDLLQRMVRLTTLADFLVETDSGQVRHSAMSAVFTRDPNAGHTARLFFDIDARSYSFFCDSIRLDPSGQSIRDGPTALAFQEHMNGTAKQRTIWEIMDEDPVQRARFHSTMQALGTFPSHYLTHVLSAYDWTRINVLVDVGGSLGHTSLLLTENFPNIYSTVQDLPKVIEQAIASVPATGHAQRISFQPHDFFQTQELVADAYLLRQILHDWPDEDAERIVRNLISAMRPGARLMVMDIVLPDPGTAPPYMEKYLRTWDISMFSLFSGKERTLSQMRQLVERCDPGLHLETVSCPPGSAATLMVWVYTPPEVSKSGSREDQDK